MELLKNKVWCIKDEGVTTCRIDEDGSFEIVVENEESWTWSDTYMTFFGEPEQQSEWFRPLTTEEQVEYLYQKALNGSAKEYRVIERWVNTDMSPNEMIEWYANLDQIEVVNLGKQNPEQYIKDRIHQALTQTK